MTDWPETTDGPETPPAALPAEGAPQPEAAAAPPRAVERLAFMSSKAEGAKAARARLAGRYGEVPPEEADVVVALGGDGLMLEALHLFRNTGTPIYGMNRGSVGFLMNEFSEDGLRERLRTAEKTALRPLIMRAVDEAGGQRVAHAFNEVALMRETNQAAKLRITVDGRVRLEELICDGILVATPAGSTAYNLSAHGPILPIDAQLLALTPISAFRPRRWRGALLPIHAHVRIDVLERERRPVAAAADHLEIRSIAGVEIAVDDSSESVVLFDAGHSWEERNLAEQFRF
ncbi:NAD kinase [Pseudoxanthobacter sp.]|uniref:NAD kinase n=1 Tax=Pseudoxanthobacter sp. TaxID=1925742 RepID=UPI002FE31B77